MNVPKELQTIIEEANINFENARFNDAAKSFKLLHSKCIQNGLINDSIYFYYRMLIAYEMDKNYNEMIGSTINLSLFLLKTALDYASKNINDIKTTREKYKTFVYMEKILYHLHEEQQQELLIKSIIDIIFEIIKESEPEDKMYYLEKGLEYNKRLEKISKSYKKEELLVTLLKCYTTHAENILDENTGFDTVDVVLHYYGKAAYYAKEYNLENIAEDYKRRIIEIAENDNNRVLPVLSRYQLS